ncbi:hypothetical protein [Azospirillum sp. sgz302134]
MHINLSLVGQQFNMYANTIALFHHALVDLGHTVQVSANGVEPAALNLFLPPMAFRSRELLAFIAERRVPYGFIGIETFEGYAHHRQDEPAGDSADFLRFVREARCILCLFHQDVEPYRALGGRAVYTKYGFHEKAEDVRLCAERPIDLFFFGDVQGRPRRERLLQGLAARGLAVRALTGAQESPASLVRNSLIGMAKANLNINHSTHVSPQRVVYLSNNRLRCLSDAAEDPDGYLESALVFDRDADFLDGCEDYVRSDRWRTDGEAAYEMVRRQPMSRTLQAAFDETL